MTESERREKTREAIKEEARREGFEVYEGKDTKGRQVLEIGYQDKDGYYYSEEAGESDDTAEVFAGWVYEYDEDSEAVEAFRGGFGRLSECIEIKKETGERIRKFSDYCRSFKKLRDMF